MVDARQPSRSRTQHVPTFPVGVVDHGVEQGEPAQGLGLLVDEADMVAPRALPLGDDVPAVGKHAGIEDIDRRLLGIGLDPGLEAARSQRGIVAPDGHGDELPAQSSVDDVGGHLAPSQRARGEVPQWALAPAGLVDRAKAVTLGPALHAHGRVRRVPQPAFDVEISARQEALDVLARCAHARRR